MVFLSKLCSGAAAVLVSMWKKLCYGEGLQLQGIQRLRLDTRFAIDSGTVRLEKRVTVNRNVSFTAIGGQLRVGGGTTFNRNCIIICREKINIGENCKFGPNVVVYDHDHVFDEEGIQPGFRTGEIIIEPGCWIGAGAIILRNTHIGTGSVIGAGTVVKGNIPPHSLVTANRTVNIEPIAARRQ